MSKKSLLSARKKLLSALGTNGLLILEHEVLAIIDLINEKYPIGLIERKHFLKLPMKTRRKIMKRSEK